MLFLNLLIFLWNKKGEFHNICFMNKSIMSCQAPKMTRTTPTICIKVVHVTCVLYFKSSEILGEFYVRKTVLNSRIIVLIWFYSMNCLKNKTLTRGKDYHKIMTTFICRSANRKSWNTIKKNIIVSKFGVGKIFQCFWKKTLLRLQLFDKKNIVKYYYNINNCYYLNILLNIIYTCGAKLNFQQHYCSLQCLLIKEM